MKRKKPKKPKTARRRDQGVAIKAEGHVEDVVARGVHTTNMPLFDAPSMRGVDAENVSHTVDEEQPASLHIDNLYIGSVTPGGAPSPSGDATPRQEQRKGRSSAAFPNLPPSMHKSRDRSPGS
jgi:hypothetical protein